MILDELTDSYFRTMAGCLKELEFDSGVLASAGLGQGNKSRNYVLRKPNAAESNPFHRLLAKRPPSKTFRVAERDEAGANALSELQDRSVNHVASALAQSADHILSFFSMLCAELGFYLACVNLRSELRRRGMPVCFPVPCNFAERKHRYLGFYDVSLALRMERQPVSNGGNANGKDLIVVTGANQGGKSSFLRSIGIAQVLMQAGTLVGAESFEANLVRGIFTHYKREEDITMRGGKFDEELKRMSTIVDYMVEDSLFLSNESFASTNEREGSDVARQIVNALLENRVKVFLVTHLFALARGLYDSSNFPILSLRAERRDDGVRTFRLIEAEPLQTSFARDLYNQIFRVDGATEQRSEPPLCPQAGTA